MLSKSFGIDFGTDTMKIYRKGFGLVFDQKSVLAEKGAGNVIAIGDEAYEMFEKSPDSIQVTFPLKNGRIAGFKDALSLLNCIFMDISRYYGKFRGADFCMAVPYDLTSVEKHSFYELLDSSIVRPKKLWLVDKPIAGSIGAGVDIRNDSGTMLVDIGAETTEVSVISQGGIVLSRLIPVGGNSFNAELISEIRRDQNLLIGNKTAESLRRALADLSGSTELKQKAFGRDLVTGLPRERELTTSFVNGALTGPLREILDLIRSLLERTPPEIAADIYNRGLYLTGGASGMTGMADFIGRNTGLKINLCPNGSLTVIEGITKIMGSKELSDLFKNEAV